MGICLRINLCVSYTLIFLASVWFVVVILINNRAEDPRINALNLIQPISAEFSDGIYLRKIHIDEQFLFLKTEGQKRNKINNFQLIQIMNDNSPNTLGDEAILIISISNQKMDLSSLKFAQHLYSKSGKNQDTPVNSSFQGLFKQQNITTQQQQQLWEETNQIPIYILRQTAPILLNSERFLIQYDEQIQLTFSYFLNILAIKKLSLLSFQLGALMSLYSLAMQKNLKLFESLSKVVLINPFNLENKMFHSPPISFVEEQIKPAILQNEQKFNVFSNLRLIIISTTRTVFQQSSVAQKYFSFSFQKVQQNEQTPSLSTNSEPFISTSSKSIDQLYRLNKTLTISTRAMSNVFCFFDKPIYFFYEPFITLLSRFFIEDSKKQFSYDELEYFFHYKQLPQVKELSQRQKKKYISKCVDFNLESYEYGGNTFGGQGNKSQACVRLLRKQSIYFEQSSILLYSKEKFEVYGENFQKLYPYQSKTTYMVYHIERINEFRRLFIINRKSALIHLKIAPIFMPQTNPIVSLQTGGNSLSPDLSQISFENLTNFQVIRTCQPANLIFPLHFAKMARFGQHSLLFNKESNKNCYTEYDNYDFYPDWFLLNWNILRNIMVFTFFLSHILGKDKKKYITSRFYSQSIVNQVLIWVNTGSFLIFQNFIVLSALCVFQAMLRYLLIGLQHLANLRKIVVKFMFVPVLLEIASIFYPNLPSSWKVLLFLLGLSISKSNIYLIVIKLSFLADSIIFDTSNLKGIIAICLWTYIGAFPYESNQKKQNKKVKQILDIGFSFSIGLCINEDGSVIDQVVNAYIVMHSILYINNKYF